MTQAPPARPLALVAYRAATGIAAPLAGPLLRARARQGKEDPARLAERLGRASAERPSGSLVWMHAVSVGESVSLLPLVDAIAAERPDLALLVTSGARAAAEVLARRLPPGALHQYAPVDTPGAVGRFLRHWRPSLGVFIESELWPNLILGARGAGVRLALISARMTEKSARAWAAHPAAVGAMLRSFDLVLPQDDATETRLATLGARIGGRLNLKRVGAPLAWDAAELARLRTAVEGRQVVVAVSTHAPEEALVADAVRQLAPRPLLVIVPRHPERGVAIAADLAGPGLARRSIGEAIGAETEIYLADTLNELGLFLRLADVAFVGKSLAHEGGGHNPLEPARLGVAVVTGPAVDNFTEIFAEMAEGGGALVVTDAAALAIALGDLLADTPRRQAVGAAALAFAQRQADQLTDALAQIRPLLPPA